MTSFLLGYGLSALLLTPVIESKLHYRHGLLSSIAIWALVCAISPLLGSLMGMLIARVILGIAEGPLFSLKTRFISDNFRAEEVGKPNAVTALGVSLGLAVGFPLVTWLMAHLGWAGSFYALAAIKLVRGLKDLNIVGMDVVEVAPAYDQSEITALAAATLALEMLYIQAAKKGE